MREVLIVDDSPDLRGMLAFTLGDLGYTVRQAKNGSDALHELAEHAPDCVVLDLMMPDIDGFKVLEAMRTQQLAARGEQVERAQEGAEHALIGTHGGSEPVAHNRAHETSGI